MNADRMHSALKKISGFIVLLLLISNLHARKLETLIAIPISGKSHPHVKKTIVHIQKQLKDAAAKEGYNLDTEIVTENGFHVTLEAIQNVDEKNVEQYAQCVSTIAGKTKTFDLTQDFTKAQFTILGFAKNWGVLKFPAPKDKQLYILARQIRACFKAAGLKVSPFEGFKAHVSLGKFIKSKSTPLPKNLTWAPDLTITLPKESFVVKNIALSTREKIEDKAKKSVTFIEEPDRIYQLGKSPGLQAPRKDPKEEKQKKEPCKQQPQKSKQEMNKEIKHKLNVIATQYAQEKEKQITPNQAYRLLTKNIRNRFAQLIKQKHAQQAIQNELALIASEKLKINANDAAAKYRFDDIKNIFNPLILRQKSTDPIIKLSEHDTIIFKALPTTIQQQLLNNRRIEFADEGKN